MHFKTLAAALPLALLAACGGSEPASDGSDDASKPTSQIKVPAERSKVDATATRAASAGGAPNFSASPVENAPAVAGATPPQAYAACQVCHSVEPGRNGVGPTLFGVVGSKAGEAPGYAFSPALKGSGITWTRESLDQWLQGPMKMVPGTKMVIGVPDAARRAAIIDYLETLK